MKSFIFSLMVIFSNVSFGETVVKLAFENENSFPWSMIDNSGVDLILLKQVDANLKDIRFEFVAVPWRRCLSQMQLNEVQGCFSASYKDEREVFGFYPTKDGKPDPELRLHSSSYSLYVKAGSAISFDGSKITGLNAGEIIGAPLGYSIADDLKKQGYEVDSTAKATELNFNKLLSGRIAAVAALTLNGDHIMNKSFNGKIVKIETPLVNKPYYLMFAKQFPKETQDIIWAEIAKVREDSSFKSRASDWISKQ